MGRYLKAGKGWRLGWNPDAPLFKGLIGGDDWAIEMTATEFQDFCRLAPQLAETMATMAADLMDAERLTCEAESETLWLEVEGYPHAFELRVLLLTGRQAEGGWPATVVSELLQALPGLMVC
ncbi:MAG: DUF1818 family protein [Cyanobacteria bacterium]|nr:DUF1818 family protein [Cyanobacteriota bacterium]MDA0866713.1 DUF1818 family protein [Cyanobacteriota bacterium]